MKIFKKTLAVILAAMFVVLCFAGCSKMQIAEKITDKTMLIAYTEECEPFIYTDENGELTGFDVEIFNKIIDNVKNESKDYKFVQVEEGYKVGEDVAYTDEDGNDYIAYVMIGGIKKNTGSFNEDFTFTEDIIDNRVITVTAKDSSITTYADLQGVDAAVVTDNAVAALDKNSTIKNGLKSATEYDDAAQALNDLASGKVGAVVIDEFTFNVLENKDDFAVLGGELETISYVYSFKKLDWYVDAINEAIYELKSSEYNDADEFTPIVEKYFGYNASNFNYQPSETK